MRRSDGRITQLPRTFPGSGICSLDVREKDDFGCVSLYASVPQTGVPALCRFNLFAELDGVQQHVASAFANTGFRGLLLSVSGFLADSWHVRGQCTSQTISNVKTALVGLDCCAAPEVRIQASQLDAQFEIAETWFQQEFLDPPRAPMGLMHGNYVALAGAIEVGPTLIPFPGAIAPAGGLTRIIHWRFTGGVGSELTFRRSGSDVLVVPIDQFIQEGFPGGNLVADAIVVTFASSYLVEGVQ